MENCIKLRINAADKSIGNKRDKAIADTIALDFEMLDSYCSQLWNVRQFYTILPRGTRK